MSIHVVEDDNIEAGRHPFNEDISLILILKGYMAFGTTSPKRLKLLLETKHGLRYTTETISKRIKEIKEGKHDYSYLDNLLDIHYPDMFMEVLATLKSDMLDLDEMSKNAESERIRLDAKKAHAAVAVNVLNVLHKGPVIRMMKQLSSKTKALSRQLVQQEAIIRDTSLARQHELNHDLYPKLITLDRDMKKIDESIDQVLDEVEKNDG